MFPLIHGWTDVARTRRTDVRLGATLALVAGAANAGGFLAVGQYTSHMTGIVSSVADHFALGNVALALAGVGAYLAFVLGAMSTAILVNWGLRRQLRSAYCLPLLLESLLLLLFGVFGAVMNLMVALFLPLTIIVLCFMMGLQNAVITKISKSEIRTTHMTGNTTDFGIELGKLIYFNRSGEHAPVLANRRRLRLHGLLIACFFAGGVMGALGFRLFGYVTTVPLALMLLTLVARPVLDDLCRRR